MFYSPGNTVRFSDNYIDLLPDRTYTIELFTDITDPGNKNKIYTVSVIISPSSKNTAGLIALPQSFTGFPILCGGCKYSFSP